MRSANNPFLPHDAGAGSFDRWIGSNAILMMMAVFLLIVLAIEILRG